MLIPASPTAAALSSAPQMLLHAQETRKILMRLHYLPLIPVDFLGLHGHIHHSYRWRFKIPRALQALASSDAWQDPWNPLVIGALYQFEAVHDLPIVPGTMGIRGLPVAIEKALLHARKKDPDPWTWILVTKFPRPEEIHLFMAGRGWIFQSKANTGVMHATPDGTWPIYARDTHTAMIGRFPIPVSKAQVRLYEAAKSAGYALQSVHYARYHHHWVQYQHYDDPDIRWVNYFDRGRAVHFYPRASYGFPQSAGCVEIPKNAARKIYGLIHYGTPVTISHGAIGPWDPPGSSYLEAPLNIQQFHLAYREIPSKSSPRSVDLQLVETAVTRSPPKTLDAASR
ncbi:L,D-transpeptidase family protein [Acidithiobacillus sp. M4-SHS-6]|uniref:L,D-transpeptidase family protein n=1 Tax=Acidithiobacillus sp. M4-SHS-6 TaxID=3383024 RepID=UPI0039BE7AEE